MFSIHYTESELSYIKCSMTVGNTTDRCQLWKQVIRRENH